MIWAARTIYRDQVFAELFSLAYTKSVSEFVEFTDRRNKVVEAWYTEASMSGILRVNLDDPL
jgi:hypothetical protein